MIEYPTRTSALNLEGKDSERIVCSTYQGPRSYFESGGGGGGGGLTSDSKWGGEGAENTFSQ